MKANREQFVELMQRLARAWSEQDTELGLSCFTEDAVYMEPPDIQLYVGHDQLRPYFAALTPGTFMRFHNLGFDEETQVGMGEYTFGEETDEMADHGVTVVELWDGRIARWREYQRKGPLPFSTFVAVKGKKWQWHIGNYP
jgi:ketosteroid isomerase-like protein